MSIESATLVDCTNTLLREIATPELKRKDVATTYFLAMVAETRGESVDWSGVNAAIVARWSMSGLIWIKKAAWKMADGGTP